MQTLRRIWNDIVRGENLDAYVTIAVALILSVMNLVGIAQSSLLPSVTLTILALLSISMLVSRHRVEDLVAKLNPSVQSVFKSRAPDAFETDIESSSDVLLVGVSLDSLLRQYYSVFERKLRLGHTIRVLLSNPLNDGLMEIVESRAYSSNRSPERAKQKTLGCLADWCNLQHIAPERMKLRVIDIPVPQRMYVLNPELSSGKIYIAHYPFRTPGGALPQYMIPARDHEWFQHFKEESENLWKAGQDWNCPSDQSSNEIVWPSLS